MCNIYIIIPARYYSSRLPGKVMMKINHKTIIERVYNQALKANYKSVIIATDDIRIYKHAQNFGANVQMTNISHNTGTDRIIEIVEKNKFYMNDIIVNVQADEPFINPNLINQVVCLLQKHSSIFISTLYSPIENKTDFKNSNIVKIIIDYFNNAIYFSRNILIYNNLYNIDYIFRHVGIYAYRVHFLLKFKKFFNCNLEKNESLEQLRILWMGYKIKVEQACRTPKKSINTYLDIEYYKKLYNDHKIHK